MFFNDTAQHYEATVQVTHVQENITHAVIGGGQAQSFEVAQTAEFFKIMSSSLYSNKKLAVVRETLCNAWDAHIEAGCTDLAVEVTLTDSKLSIRDFGMGIAPAKIVPIYGTYGGSTKAANANVTGGFGLGCKAPFAVVDHFEVISFHKGTKTIYNMALSSAQVAGKPGIQTLVTLPTDETGLQVSLDLPNGHRDQQAFELLIRRIVAAGEMRVKLNGEELKVLPFSRANDGFLIVERIFVEENASKIHVRYGNVVYPVPSHDEYATDHMRAARIVEKVGGDGYNSGRRHLILQAAPNTISVTPSRETLEMTDQTIATIGKLLDQFVKGFRANLGTKAVEVAYDSIDRIWLNNKPAALFSDQLKIPNLTDSQGKLLEGKKVLTEFTDVSRQHLAHTYPDTPDFRIKELRLRLDALIRAGFDRTGLLRKFRLDLIKNKGKAPKGWLTQKMVWPLLRSMGRNELLDQEALFFWTGGSDYRSNLANLVEVKRWQILGGTRDHLPYLRGIVILSHNRRDIIERVHGFPLCQHWLGHAAKSLVYLAPRNPAKLQAAREFFTGRGYHLIDLTTWHSWETKPEKVVKAGPKKKLKKGVALLSTILDGIQLQSERAYSDDAERTENPEFYVKLAARTNKVDLSGLGDEASLAVTRLFGKQGGIVANDPQACRMEHAGIHELRTWLYPKLKDEFLSNKLLKEFYSYSLRDMWLHGVGKIDLTDNEHAIISGFFKSSELRKHFGLPDALPQRERDFVTIWECVYRCDKPELKEVRDFLKSIPIHPKAEILYKKIRGNKLLQFLKLSPLDVALRGTSSPEVIKFVKNILEG